MVVVVVLCWSISVLSLIVDWKTPKTYEITKWVEKISGKMIIYLC